MQLRCLLGAAFWHRTGTQTSRWVPCLSVPTCMGQATGSRVGSPISQYILMPEYVHGAAQVCTQVVHGLLSCDSIIVLCQVQQALVNRLSHIGAHRLHIPPVRPLLGKLTKMCAPPPLLCLLYMRYMSTGLLDVLSRVTHLLPHATIGTSSPHYSKLDFPSTLAMLP